MEASIKLSNNPVVIGSTTDFTYKWGINAGLDQKTARRLALAVSEVVTDIVLFAFNDLHGDFEISFRNHVHNVEVIIHEFGEPFDPERHRYDVERVKKNGNFEGAGFEIIKHMVDDFIFLNRGKNGKEFRLIQNIITPHITEIIPFEELEPTQAEKYLFDEDEPHYSIQPITPEDAEDISKLIYRTYGYTYIKEELYFPKKIELSLEQDEKFGVITRTREGEAIGYFAVVFSTDSNIGEVGEAVVSVKHRKRGIMTRMLNRLIEISRDRGLLGLFGEGTTAHIFSQKVNAKFGFKSTAMVISCFPEHQVAGLDKTAYCQKLSSVIDFLPLRPLQSLEYYLPAEYKKIIKGIYENLGTSVSDKRMIKQALPPKTKIDVQILYEYSWGIIVIREFGKNFIPLIIQTIHDLQNKDISTINIDLPLDQPTTKVIVSDLKKQGFFFSGVMPLFHREKDYLRFQNVKNYINYDLIYPYSDMSIEIKNLILEEIGWK